MALQKIILKTKPPFENREILSDWVENNSRELHKYLESRLKEILSDLNENGFVHHELYAVPGGRVDSIAYNIDGVPIHIEYLCSKSQVPQNLRLLEQSPCELRVAVVADPDLKPGVLEEYFHKKPTEPFPVILMSELLLKGRESQVLQTLKAIATHGKTQLLLSRNLKMRRLVLDQLNRNCNMVWERLIGKPIHPHSAKIATYEETDDGFDLMMKEEGTSSMRMWNILQVGMHSGINRYIYPHLKQYSPQLIEIADDIRKIALHYYELVGRLQKIVQEEIKEGEGFNPIVPCSAFLMGELKLPKPVRHTGDRWSDAHYKIIEDNIDKLNYLKSQKKVKEIIDNIVNDISNINDLHFHFKQLSEFEKLL